MGVADSAEFVVTESPRRRYARKKRSRMTDEKLRPPHIGKCDLNTSTSQGRVKEPPLLLTGVAMHNPNLKAPPGRDNHRQVRNSRVEAPALHLQAAESGGDLRESISIQCANLHKQDLDSARWQRSVPSMPGHTSKRKLM